MKLFDYLIENKIIEKKEFNDLHSVRDIKINDKIVSDPNINIQKSDKITIGIKNINIY